MQPAAKRVRISPQVQMFGTSSTTGDPVKRTTGRQTIFPMSNFGTNSILAFGRVSQGTSDNQRVGKSIRHIGYELRVRLRRENGSNLGSAAALTVRVVHGIWKQASDALGGRPPTAPELFDYISPAELIAAPIQSKQALNLVILGDEMFAMPATACVQGVSGGTCIGEDIIVTRKINHEFTQQYWDPFDNTPNWTHFIAIIPDSESDGVGGIAPNSALVTTCNYYTDA